MITRRSLIQKSAAATLAARLGTLSFAEQKSNYRYFDLHSHFITGDDERATKTVSEMNAAGVSAFIAMVADYPNIEDTPNGPKAVRTYQPGEAGLLGGPACIGRANSPSTTQSARAAKRRGAVGRSHFAPGAGSAS